MQLQSIELLGLVAGMFGTFASAPQAIKIIRTRQARDVSLTMYLMAFTGSVLWGLYGWLQGAFSIMFWNAVALLIFSSIIWLKLRHSREAG
ncbi:MAG TPA: SemiSWEET family transporter [Hyphomonas sp.]|nr:SemiSWEET family transporter [Hyphomonas sp.]HRK69905.1 SemiSWEET family transporter [Hyphomonas sp.]